MLNNFEKFDKDISLIVKTVDEIYITLWCYEDFVVAAYKHKKDIGITYKYIVKSFYVNLNVLFRKLIGGSGDQLTLKKKIFQIISSSDNFRKKLRLKRFKEKTEDDLKVFADNLIAKLDSLEKISDEQLTTINKIILHLDKSLANKKVKNFKTQFKPNFETPLNIYLDIFKEFYRNYYSKEYSLPDKTEDAKNLFECI